MPTANNSGFPTLVENFRERLLSDDLNRAQQFLASHFTELLRRQHLALAQTSEGAGKTTPASAVASPLRALIFEGLRFRPEIGTANGFVEAGIAIFAAPENDPHPADSPARLISDPGVQSAGVLTLTAGGGGARIDVVEVSVKTSVLESDNRSIFNPQLGEFEAKLVDKVRAGRLAYRIRTGTAGAGFPGTALGWLPLAVCLVPSSATTWDDCTVWDVRPLLADLAHPPHMTLDRFERVRPGTASAIEEGSGNWRARGCVEGTLGGWKVGGEFATPASGQSYIDLTATDVQETGFSATASKPWYLYFAQPFGLPRWCKLSPASSGERTPQEPRGIPIFSQKVPAGLAAKPSALQVITIPTALGLGGTTSNALPVIAGAFGSGAVWCGLAQGSDGWTSIGDPGIALAPSSGANTSAVTYQLATGGGGVPGNATAVRVRLVTTFTDAAGYVASCSRNINVKDGIGGNTVYARRHTGPIAFPASGSFVEVFEVELPLPPSFPSGSNHTVEIALTITAASGGSQAFSSQSCLVVGWLLNG